MAKRRTTYTATEARKDFYKLLRSAAKPGNRVRITLQGQDPVVLISEDEIEGWIETIEVMSDPQLVKDIKEAEERGDYKDWEDVKKELGLED